MQAVGVRQERCPWTGYTHCMQTHLFFNRYRIVFITLVLASALCASMWVVRFAITGETYRFFLNWNLFLAWVPLGFALLARHARNQVGFALFGLAWLLFFPNAPYLITDLVHLRAFEPTIRYWYDLMMFMTFIWTGFLLGFVSLYVMQRRVAEMAGHVVSWGFALISLALGAFGVYLGRFQRYNSWDVLIQPWDLFYDIYQRVRHPFDHMRTYGISLLLAVFLIGMYVTMYAIAHLPREQTQR